ncbi:MAG: type VI secretion system baseplate subunit TssF [Fibromonadaceae bacterium]|jgi:type VI protein secretion system component VasA|nr:type VI secretion system baseplate subunit TssF [Fibromonadaceae bacterium]
MNLFEQELKALKEAKKEFDNVYQSSEFDFNSEQILFGLASLTARIRTDILETENEIARDFVKSIAPELLLPLPARSLAEIIPAISDNQAREIQNGTLLSSKGKSSGEKNFIWETIGKHKLNPTQKIISVKATEDSEGFDCLEFESRGNGPWIIYINGESEFAWSLWYFILEYAKPPIMAKPYVIAQPQNPWQLCRDFFCFEEKFRYIYMENLPSKFRFAKKIPRDVFSKICTENFKLNVLPIENAFEQNLKLTLLDEKTFEAKIFPNEKRQIILSLKEVLAGSIKRANFEKVKYRYSSEKISYANLPPNSDTLSICAIVCDGTAAASTLEQGSALLTKDSAMQACEIRSVINAMPFLRPFAGREPEWGILGLLQQNYLQFFEGDTLKNALEMQTWNAQGKYNYLAQCIKNVFLENKSAVHKGCIVPMANVKITLSLDFLDIRNYGFLGILRAYGEMLFYLFRKIFICNMLVRLILRIEPFGKELTWE